MKRWTSINNDTTYPLKGLILSNEIVLHIATWSFLVPHTCSGLFVVGVWLVDKVVGFQLLWYLQSLKFSFTICCRCTIMRGIGSW